MKYSMDMPSCPNLPWTQHPKPSSPANRLLTLPVRSVSTPLTATIMMSLTAKLPAEPIFIFLVSKCGPLNRHLGTRQLQEQLSFVISVVIIGLHHHLIMLYTNSIMSSSTLMSLLKMDTKLPQLQILIPLQLQLQLLQQLIPMDISMLHRLNSNHRLSTSLNKRNHSMKLNNRSHSMKRSNNKHTQHSHNRMIGTLNSSNHSRCNKFSK